MAEICINPGNSHRFHAASGSVSVKADILLGTCTNGHSNCTLEHYTTFNVPKYSQQLQGHQGSGEIKVLNRHSHAYNEPSGSRILYNVPHTFNTCPLGHANCRATLTNKTVANSVISSESSEFKQTGEILINVPHSHNYYSCSAVNIMDVAHASCPSGHSSCKPGGTSSVNAAGAPSPSVCDSQRI